MDNMTGAEKAKEIRNSIFALLIAFIFLFPIYWLIQISFKSDAETFGKVLTYFPHDFTFEPWLENLTDKTFLISLKNSFLNGLLTMAIALVLGVPAAYGMGRYRVKGGNVFLLTFLISQMLPPSLTLTPMYLIFSKLGFLGNHLTAPVAIAASSSGFGFWFRPESAKIKVPSAPYSQFGTTIRKNADTSFVPGFVFRICRHGRSVSAVEWHAPDTIPSASPIFTIITP